MTDYRVNRDVGYFGTDNPATAVAERMPFVVQIDGKNKVVNIGIVSGQHGSHVAGIIAANGMFGGAMSGAAPGAQLVSVRVCLFIAGCTAHALVEGMIYAAKNANVDVINMSIGGLPALNDANNTRAVLYDRLIEQYNVQMFISAGNSGRGEHDRRPLGRHEGDERRCLHHRRDVGIELRLKPHRRPGPTTSTPSARAAAQGWRLQAGRRRPRCRDLHDAALAGGRSGPRRPRAAARLLDAQRNVDGLTAGRRRPRAPGQRRGAVGSPAPAGAAPDAQLERALPRQLWRPRAGQRPDRGREMRDALATNAIKTVDISSSVAVDTSLEQFFATPGNGVGIHDREGVELGESYTRTYTFKRTSGSGGTKTYNVSWEGNDGTFSSGGSISLPLNANVSTR